MGEYAEMERERAWDDEFGIRVGYIERDFRVWRAAIRHILSIKESK